MVRNEPPMTATGIAAVQAIVEFFEQLGVCIAVFAGAAAIVKFRVKVFPFCPTIASILGVILLFGSFVLAILVAGSWFTRHTSGIKSKWVLLVLVFVVTATTVFFVVAGGYAAIAALKA